MASNPEFSIIVPTLNEETHVGFLLKSLRSQSISNFEVLLVDGGSQDRTAKIAEALGARVFVLRNSKEFEARNFAVQRAKAPILVFTCADVIFPPGSLEMVLRGFQNNFNLVALTGPDLPYDGGSALMFVYRLYNTIRFLFSKLPHPLKAFSSSTNFLVVRKTAFQQAGGFKPDDVNADGLMGRYLADHHRVRFDNKVIVYISARRASNWGIARFGRHYLYVLENFFPGVSSQEWFQRLKSKSGTRHGEIHVKTTSLD